jgi:hypothetical protein
MGASIQTFVLTNQTDDPACRIHLPLLSRSFSRILPLELIALIYWLRQLMSAISITRPAGAREEGASSAH